MQLLRGKKHRWIVGRFEKTLKKMVILNFSDSTAEGKLADQVLLDAAQALVSKCTQWIRAPGNKFAMFNGTVKQLQREFERQMSVQRRLM